RVSDTRTRHNYRARVSMFNGTEIQQTSSPVTITWASASSGQSDAPLIQAAQQAAAGRPQPQSNEQCLVYAQARGIGAVARGNTGAFNILYQGNDAKLVGSDGKLLDFTKIITATDRFTASVGARATASRKPTVTSLAGRSDLTQVLHPGDFIVWDRGAGGVD